jgi:hypothetical protein
MHNANKTLQDLSAAAGRDRGYLLILQDLTDELSDKSYSMVCGLQSRGAVLPEAKRPNIVLFSGTSKADAVAALVSTLACTSKIKQVCTFH